MGFWNRLTREAPPTVTDPAVEESNTDPEKAIDETVEVTSPAGHHVSPEIEKRIVRKLDLRFTPLVAFLCMT
jgi:hypothetical protein